MPANLTRESVDRLIVQATESVFTTMLNLTPVPQPARWESGDRPPREGMIAMVGIVGTWTGMGQIYCSAALACELSSALLMTEYKSVDGDVLDAVAEVANMIIGNVKTSLEEVLGPLGLGVPTVIYGRNYQARTGGMQEWTVVPFLCGEHTLEIQFCLIPTPARLFPPTATKPETVLV